MNLLPAYCSYRKEIDTGIQSASAKGVRLHELVRVLSIYAPDLTYKRRTREDLDNMHIARGKSLTDRRILVLVKKLESLQ